MVRLLSFVSPVWLRPAGAKSLKEVNNLIEFTLEEYADMIYNDPTQRSLYKKNIISDLQGYKNQLEALHNHKIKPSIVVGTGYVNPRKVAIEWLEQRIAEYQSIIDRTTIHSVVRSNYECYIRTRANTP